MAYTTINKHTNFFTTKLYSGNGASSNAITGVGHQPDLVWLKDRTEASDHQIQDSVRGKSGSNYYYIAFADEPIVANVGNSIPATAK